MNKAKPLTRRSSSSGGNSEAHRRSHGRGQAVITAKWGDTGPQGPAACTAPTEGVCRRPEPSFGNQKCKALAPFEHSMQLQLLKGMAQKVTGALRGWGGGGTYDPTGCELSPGPAQSPAGGGWGGVGEGRGAGLLGPTWEQLGMGQGVQRRERLRSCHLRASGVSAPTAWAHGLVPPLTSPGAPRKWPSVSEAQLPQV